MLSSQVNVGWSVSRDGFTSAVSPGEPIPYNRTCELIMHQLASKISKEPAQDCVGCVFEHHMLMAQEPNAYEADSRLNTGRNDLGLIFTYHTAFISHWGNFLLHASPPNSSTLAGLEFDRGLRISVKVMQSTVQIVLRAPP